MCIVWVYSVGISDDVHVHVSDRCVWYVCRCKVTSVSDERDVQ